MVSVTILVNNLGFKSTHKCTHAHTHTLGLVLPIISKRMYVVNP